MHLVVIGEGNKNKYSGLFLGKILFLILIFLFPKGPTSYLLQRKVGIDKTQDIMLRSITRSRLKKKDDK